MLLVNIQKFTDHFTMTGVESLFDQRELVLAQTALNLQHVAENPRFVLQFQFNRTIH